MMLIVDSGSSKTLWTLVKHQQTVHYKSSGFNPYYMDEEYIKASIFGALSEFLDFSKVSKLYYYGAGCSPEKKGIVEGALKAVFKCADIFVESDMLAAARALLGTKSGFAAILGTGTNSCYYDGKTIVNSIDSLGFLAGDEGSGSYLGKKVIRAFVRDDFPNELIQPFKEQFGLSKKALIEELYLSETPNKYCATFAMFASKNLSHPFIENLVADSFRDFFKEIITKYQDYKNKQIAFVGSVAFVFSDLLGKVAMEYEMTLSKVLKDPIDGLINYHIAVSSL